MKEIKKYDELEKMDSKEFIEDFQKLSKKEQEKIYYMIQGAILVNETHEKTNAV